MGMLISADIVIQTGRVVKCIMTSIPQWIGDNYKWKV